jgi:hypothetical protein
MSGNPDRGGSIDLSRALHVQGFVGALMVKEIDKVVEFGLLFLHSLS